MTRHGFAGDILALGPRPWKLCGPAYPDLHARYRAVILKNNFLPNTMRRIILFEVYKSNTTLFLTFIQIIHSWKNLKISGLIWSVFLRGAFLFWIWLRHCIPVVSAGWGELRWLTAWVCYSLGWKSNASLSQCLSFPYQYCSDHTWQVPVRSLYAESAHRYIFL